jgi:hypothetical protein
MCEYVNIAAPIESDTRLIGRQPDALARQRLKMLLDKDIEAGFHLRHRACREAEA